jgi:ribosomal protein S18 acetylase RimI-like enzyme
MPPSGRWAARSCPTCRWPHRTGAGAGLGRALLDASEQAARDAGWNTIGLSVTVSNPDNELARSIYLRRGYRDSGQGEYHDGYHYHDAVGIRRYHGEQHVYLIKRLTDAGC